MARNTRAGTRAAASSRIDRSNGAPLSRAECRRLRRRPSSLDHADANFLPGFGMQKAGLALVGHFGHHVKLGLNFGLHFHSAKNHGVLFRSSLNFAHALPKL